MKTKLSVNVNKLATLRNSRGKNTPDLISYTKHIIECGAQGITVHPRPDERHIRYEDVIQLREFLKQYKEIELNVEGYPNEKFLSLVKKIKPHQCTLVPDAPDVLTSNAGWELSKNKSLLKLSIQQIKNLSVRVSLFLDPFSMTGDEWLSLINISPDRIELYTEHYADVYAQGSIILNGKSFNKKEVLQKYKEASQRVKKEGIGVNAGHDLNQKNVKVFLKEVEVQEVSIGHALICEALKEGLEITIKKYLAEM